MFKHTKNIYLMPFDKLMHAPTLFSWIYDAAYSSYFRDFQRPLTREDVDVYPALTGSTVLMVHNMNEQDAIGMVTLHDYRANVGSVKGGVMMAANKQKSGLGVEALWILMDYVFNSLRLNKMIVEAVAGNERILKMIKDVGADHEGTFVDDAIVDGELVTVLRYALKRDKTISVINALAKKMRGI